VQRCLPSNRAISLMVFVGLSRGCELGIVLLG
jgi:hypothetical protein